MTSSSGVRCEAFLPATGDPIICRECRTKWAAHSVEARKAFGEAASNGVIQMVEHRLAYVGNPNAKPCTVLRIIKYGDNIQLCECGRMIHEHPLKLIKGMTKKELCFKRIEVTDGCYRICGLTKNHMGQCAPTDHTRQRLEEIIEIVDQHMKCRVYRQNPRALGRCVECNRRYIDHSGEERGRIIEDHPDSTIHQAGCLSVIKLGSEWCSCLTDEMKQSILERGDGVADDPPPPRRSLPGVCELFNPHDPQTDSMCKTCHQRFYAHTEAAREGIILWSEWRSLHMTDAQVLEWFEHLATTQRLRMECLKVYLEDPKFLHPTAPHPTIIRALYDALPLSMKSMVTLKLPKSLDDPYKVQRDAWMKDGPRDNCFSCNEPLMNGEMSMCMGCQSLTSRTKPTLVKAIAPPTPIIPSGPAITASGDWESEGGPAIEKFD